MTRLKQSSLFRFVRTIPVASVVAVLASTTIAGDLEGDVTDPPVVSPKRLGDDVSAFYIGLTAGYGGGGDDRFGLTTPAGTFGIGDQDLSGAYGGLRGGWRGVLPARGGRDYIYGFELGYDFGSLDDSVTAQVGSDTVQGGSDVSDVLSVRFRNGLTNRSGRILYFVSFGYLWGDVETTNSISSPTTGTQSFEASDRRNGFSLSIGAEHYLNENWSITGEYEYVQFESKDIEFSNGFSTKSTPNYRGLRFGLNYKF